MAWRDATVGQSIVIVANGAVRAAQIITGILTIYLYINEKEYWTGCGMPARINYEFVLGSLCIVTGLVLGFIPLKMSYRPVALAAPWDAIMFFMYSAAFGVMRKAPSDIANNTANDYSVSCISRKNAKNTTGNTKKYQDHLSALHDKSWVNLAGMLLFLTSAILGITLLWVGRNRGLTSRHSAV
ncbi:hypothetical protein H2200_005895 [Cladophialophora chaetospira]|uniref:MARVEL domain-containing protein n=1 Tax=Cladophialophora chaetospira TaxID=386627 RepID=A0AA39CI14_9EURO|nr:hypothetical protein H2200_005895 [Cladophialophora chaetospira]